MQDIEGMSHFGKVAVLMGGRSAEREISLRSGGMVLGALRKQGVDAHAFDPRDQGLEQLIAQNFDRAFIALHGRFGEDGTVQGALEYLGIPYTGSGVMASALAMDKLRTKLIWLAGGIPTPRHALLDAATDHAALTAALGLPLVVKPVHEGSSIGVSKVVSIEKIDAAFELARRHDDTVIAEQFIDGPELTVGILGAAALPVIRIEAPQGNYDYQNKYFGNETKYHCPCGLPPAQERAIQSQALAAFRLLGCHGWGRVDLMLDKGGNPFFLEMNTIPGMTDHSLVPMAARAQGLSFEDLVIRILESAHVG
ncbi:MAG TPA: D-alanine--D-alanine ligase [Burkholderiales bacterium]|nr:D-alanine--D-alanine ligase [Burkholderiales bacterium]